MLRLHLYYNIEVDKNQDFFKGGGGSLEVRATVGDFPTRDRGMPSPLFVSLQSFISFDISPYLSFRWWGGEVSPKLLRILKPLGIPKVIRIRSRLKRSCPGKKSRKGEGWGWVPFEVSIESWPVIWLEDNEVVTDETWDEIAYLFDFL